ncbi:alcohol dehydrogenase YqhD (iron-dependent ADH family) [Bacilli bacterium PM5-3]|nr:alcohol dehydrogenase YqhD (iron-dependent ADH family) [Bacilli bacterium PM5-3]MDH6604055.1 alcohol dehydrogenase YqhD (iron-dependent ADH family) [Bacilli bacterium PM5-9]
MNNFTYQRVTKLIFGQNQLEKLPQEIKKNGGSRVLLTYGQSSIKRIGLYDEVVRMLNDNDIFFVELGGIKPNPEVDTAREGVRLINEHNLDFILAVGGGSVLDNSKHIAMSQAADVDVWDLVRNQDQLDKVTGLIKIGAILTISATGSEMNVGGVITNPETEDKLSMAHEEAAPVFSFLNPRLLESLPPKQRIAGVCDTFSHLLELYFTAHEDEGFADRYIEGVMKNVIAYAPKYLEDNLNYDANAQIMLSATYALNGISTLGKYGGDWNTHALEHELSALTDFTHGIGLAIIQPYVLQTYLDADLANKKDLVKFVNLGKNVFDIEGSNQEVAQKTVEAIKKLFFEWIDNKTQLSEYEVYDFNYSTCVEKLLNDARLSDIYHSFTKEELDKIYKTIL